MRRFPNVRLFGPVDDSDPGGLTEAGDEIVNDAIQYVLRGRVRSVRDDIQVSLRFSDRQSVECLWAQNYHWPRGAAGSAQSEEMFVRRVAVTLADWDGVIPSLDALGEAGGVGDQPLTPYQAAMKARKWGVTLSDSAFLEALQHLKDCVAANPDCGNTHAILSDLYFSDYLSGIGHVDHALDLAESHAQRAGTLDPANPLTHWALGQAAFVRDNYDLFESEFSRAISLNPNDVTINASYGLYSAGLGELDRAMDSFRTAMGLSCHVAPWAYMIPWLYHFQSEDYAAALIDAESIETPGLLWGALTHAACFGMSGMDREAAAALAELLELQPRFPVDGRAVLGRLIRCPQLQDRILQGLVRAGLRLSAPENQFKMEPAGTVPARTARGRSGS